MRDFEAGNYDAALRSFQSSFETVASPNSRFMVARTLAKLGRNAEAFNELNRVIADADALGGRYDATAEAARAKRVEIRDRVGVLTVDSSKLPKGSVVSVEGEVVSKEALKGEIPVLPGDVTVSAKMPNGGIVEEKVKIIAGAEESVTLNPSKTPSESGSAPVETGSYIERSRHIDYFFELELHGRFTTLEPPGPPNTGGGPGARLSIEVIRGGLFNGLNDSLGLSVGGDWVVTSAYNHVWVPLVFQYNIWVSPKWSFLAEPGVALKFIKEAAVTPAFQVGARYMVSNDFLAVTARAGLPAVSLGVAAFF
jgi:hypothetical protein